MTYPRIAAAVLTVLALTGCAVTAPTTATTPDTVLSLPSSSPIAPWPGPDAPISSAPASDGPAPAVTTDPGTGATTDPGAAAPAATRAATTKAAPRTTAPAAPKTTQAAPPPPPKTTAAPAKPWIKLTSCIYDTATGKTLGKWSYYSPSASTTYQITINGYTFPAVPAGVGTGVASAKYFGPGTSCSATIS